MIFLKLIKNSINAPVIFYIILAIFLYIISFHIPLTADDFSYSMSRMTGERLQNIFDVIQSVGHEYMTWNGRILAYFSAQLFLIGGSQIIFRLLYPIATLIVIYEMNVVITGEYRITQSKMTTLIFSASVLFGANILVLNQTMFWLIGWCTYILPLVFMFFCLVPIASITTRKEVPHAIFKNPAALIVSSFCACLFVEHYSLLMLGFPIAVYFFRVLQTKEWTMPKEIKYVLFGSVLGCLVIFLAPGILVRQSTDDFAAYPLLERLYFGWTRFVYTNFYLNQIIFLALSVVSIVYHFKQKNFVSRIVIFLHIPIILLSPLFIFELDFFKPMMIDALSGAWSYYSYEMASYFKYSLVVLYYLLVFFVDSLYISKKENEYFAFILYGAAVCSNLCFILSDKACERTQFISWLLLGVEAIFIFKYLNLNSKKAIFTLNSVSLIAMLCIFVNFSLHYVQEYNKYKENEQRFIQCKIDNCQEVFIKEYDYDYVFKSEVNFDNQNNWVLRDIRRYYNLDKDVHIIPEGEE